MTGVIVFPLIFYTGAFSVRGIRDTVIDLPLQGQYTLVIYSQKNNIPFSFACKHGLSEEAHSFRKTPRWKINLVVEFSGKHPLVLGAIDSRCEFLRFTLFSKTIYTGVRPFGMTKMSARFRAFFLAK